ncbi:putative NADPH-quinone reductase [Chryseobacterium ginsenosidimutans]|uniref:NAD(P)H-dependent oxidoreductase n=1 Tax=Chryseobacterium ginsenosidimutans TaxID=687846 RepID=UPI00216AA8A5|nr:NAD(P)H-dependent oxidoreductase [Chryseobacterium ginsenosidimutans]MCS3869611.1 putative NADPH-quinone reductase [Chryseobacterium ginsenosidimutans]
MKNILLILGHPSKDSFSNALLEAYKKGAESEGATVKTIYISDLDFNVNLSDGYRNRRRNGA